MRLTCACAWGPLSQTRMPVPERRRTVDYTGPYVRLLQERLSQPRRVCFRTVPPTAAGALEVAATPHDGPCDSASDLGTEEQASCLVRITKIIY